MFAQPLEEFIVNDLAGDRHTLAVLDRNAFTVAVHIATTPFGQGGDFGFPVIDFDRTDRIDIDSERAAVDRGDPHIDQCKQRRRQLR